jgi:hypothetical protein
VLECLLETEDPTEVPEDDGLALVIGAENTRDGAEEKITADDDGALDDGTLLGMELLVAREAILDTTSQNFLIWNGYHCLRGKLQERLTAMLDL